MHVQSRNVGTMFKTLVEGIHSGRIPTEPMASRYGEVLCIEEPIILTYKRPLERCLFNPQRDCNPSALLFEALWTLAGRNDVAPLAYYFKRAAEFSDDGRTWNDSYGHRWRESGPFKKETPNNDPTDHNGPYVTHERVDQLKVIIDHLRRKPESRRAVLQMWNVEDDLLKIDNSRAVCCNLSVLFAVENGRCKACKGTGILQAESVGSHQCWNCKGKPHDRPRYLNMTVFNRSNDLVWGATNANAVCFSFLQEYMAAHLGLEVGKYHQVSNNLHVYVNTWKPEEWLKDYEQGGTWSHEWYNSEFRESVPLVLNPQVFDEELPRFVEHHSQFRNPLENHTQWREPFFATVAEPLLNAYHVRKQQLSRSFWLDSIKDDAWRIMARGWCERRAAKWEKEAKHVSK